MVILSTELAGKLWKLARILENTSMKQINSLPYSWFSGKWSHCSLKNTSNASSWRGKNSLFHRIMGLWEEGISPPPQLGSRLTPSFRFFFHSFQAFYGKSMCFKSIETNLWKSQENLWKVFFLCLEPRYDFPEASVKRVRYVGPRLQGSDEIEVLSQKWPSKKKVQKLVDSLIDWQFIPLIYHL